MNSEIPQSPEQEGAPERGQVFNVDGMTDEQIYTAFTRLVSIGLLLLDNHPDDRPFMDGMIDQLTADVFDLASRDPERVRNMVRTYSDSDSDTRQEFAAEIAPALLDYDHELTRDTLISIAVGEGQRRVGDGVAAGAANSNLRFIVRDRLTPEQVADWQAHYAQFEPDRPLEAAYSGWPTPWWLLDAQS